MADISVSRIAKKELGATWGHEWAAVAWMALCVEAAGEKPENVTAWMLSRDPYFNHVGEM